MPLSYRRGKVFDHMETGSACYLIEDRNRRLVKIGWSADPVRRLRELIAESSHHMRLVATLPGGRFREAALHARFTRKRVRGEWFAPSIELYAAFGIDNYAPFKKGD